MINQLAVLAENLDNKIDILEAIKEYDINQKEALSKSDIEIDDFDDDLDEKEVLIQKLEELDEGFDEIYQGVADQIQTNKAKYADQIRGIQGKIVRINTLSAEINDLEADNKKLISNHFDKMKADIKQGRQGSKAAYGYYRNMSGGMYNTHQVMDSKF